MESLNRVLDTGRSILAKNNIDTSEARLLLAFVLGVEKEKLVTIGNVCDKDLKRYLMVLEKRVNGTPYAYIVGYKEFMGIRFIVNKNVLIPRPDTEILVEEAIKLNKSKVLDLCTGSGCIAISLHKKLVRSQIIASDVSNEALNVAKINAKNNDADIEFIKSDLFENIKYKFDLIVSNPPYIKTEVIKKLQQEVKKEPVIALDGGFDGLDFYKKIVNEAPKFLNKNGVLMFEIGYDEAKDILKLLEKDFENVEVIKDLSGNDRVIKATLIERGE